MQADPKSASPLIRIDHISKSYQTRQGKRVIAVDNLSLTLKQGEILGLIGASGSGKTTLARLIVGLEQADRGQLWFAKTNLALLSLKQRRPFYRHIQLIFQDPYSSLTPRRRVVDIVAEPLRIQKITRPHQPLIETALQQVGLSVNYLSKYPAELSGGERQRVAIARTIILNPQAIIADEIVSMLDSSHKRAILEVLLHLRAEHHLTMLFITHDVAVASYLCDRIAVMEQGRLVEVGPTTQLLQASTHPYTKALIEAVPRFTNR